MIRAAGETIVICLLFKSEGVGAAGRKGGGPFGLDPAPRPPDGRVVALETQACECRTLVDV